MKLGKEIPREDFNKWIQALRSGEYSQTKAALQDEHGYCCLGVACKVLIPSKDLELDEHGRLTGAYPICQNGAPAWLNNMNWGIQYKIKTTISGLNDYIDLTFDEIADILELTFVHGAFE